MHDLLSNLKLKDKDSRVLENNAERTAKFYYSTKELFYLVFEQQPTCIYLLENAKLPDLQHNERFFIVFVNGHHIVYKNTMNAAQK